MNKLSKLALLVTSVITTQAFAAEAGKIDAEVYGAVGVTSQLNAESASSSVLDTRTGEEFRAYQDSKLGVKLGYGVNDHFSVHSEIKGDFEGKDAEVRVQELFVKGEFGQFDVELGRFRTPVYMNTLDQDRDFDLSTYRGVRTFSTQDSALETLDGVSVGYKVKSTVGDLEFRALTGQTDDREVKLFDLTTMDTLTYETSAKNVWGLSTTLDSKFGEFRVAHLQAELDSVVDFKTTSVGYEVTRGMMFVEAEIAMEKLSNVGIPDIKMTKGYVTVGVHADKFTPSLTLNMLDTKDAEDYQSVEVALAYDLTSNVRLKGAYEYVEMSDTLDDSVVSLGASFRF